MGIMWAVRRPASGESTSTSELTLMPELNFDGHNTLYATHGLHAFAAKCPPQLVWYGLRYYSKRGDMVLDPMAGSGTTLIEARLLGRHAIGYDIDPLAVLLSRVKSRPLRDSAIENAYHLIRERFVKDFTQWQRGAVPDSIKRRATPPDFHNRDYWFNEDVAAGLAILAYHIASAAIRNNLKEFMWATFSSLILARTSVANARDIIHSRHHHYEHSEPPDVLRKFDQRMQRMRRHMTEYWSLCEEREQTFVHMGMGDARKLPLKDGQVDLIFTSPPYATALDYPRAHFLAIPWMEEAFGLSVEQYMKRGSEYIGSERGRLPDDFAIDTTIENFASARAAVKQLSERSIRQAKLVQRYFQDMYQSLYEMKRVLRKGAHAILVVCPSHIRKVQIPTHTILIDMAENMDLPLKKEHIRVIDERKRLLPYMQKEFGKRMSTEYVLIFEKK